MGRKFLYKVCCWRVSACFWAVGILVLAGGGYRVASSGLQSITASPVVLPVPLSAIDKKVNGWAGKDVAIDENVLRVAGNDDFINRLYENASSGQWAGVYVAYSARPRTMLGHRPVACYVGGGWVHDSTERYELISDRGRKIPALLHNFHMPGPGYEQIVVINYYVVNGRVTVEEKGFSGLGWRTPNIAGNAARYVAQVQINSVMENSARQAAEELTESIIKFLPDTNGF